jgi:uncharacterized protein YodC (DUF2158 family)
MADHPRLTPEDIRAAQAFAADYLADEALVRSGFAMTKQSFKIGDTVTLTSGGHLMTVISVDSEDVITCAWSVKEDLKSKGFPRAALIKADKPKTLEEYLAD